MRTCETCEKKFKPEYKTATCVYCEDCLKKSADKSVALALGQSLAPKKRQTEEECIAECAREDKRLYGKGSLADEWWGKK